MGQPEVHILQFVHSSTFLTLYVDNVVGNFKKAPQGHTNLQKPFLPKQ